MPKSSPARRNSDGSVTRPTGQASPASSSGTGRSFTPPGAKAAAGGPPIRRSGGNLTPGPRTAANKVQK